MGTATDIDPPQALSPALFGDSTSEALDVDHPPPMQPACNGLGAVVSVDLEGDNSLFDVNHPGAAGYRESLGHRGEVFDLDERTNTSLVLIEARRNAVPGRVFEVSDQPGGGQDCRHAGVSKRNSVRRSNDHALLAHHAGPGNRLQRKGSFEGGLATERRV